MPNETTADWRTLPAGRELDTLVAGRVMGWRMVADPDRALPPRGARRWLVPNSYHPRALPLFSVDIAAAWLVVEAIQRQHPGWRFSLLGGDVCLAMVHHHDESGAYVGIEIDDTRRQAFGWHVEFHGHEDPRQDYGQRHASEYADTAPLAICRAALAAVEAKDA